jgi:hypothetical protein
MSLPSLSSICINKLAVQASKGNMTIFNHNILIPELFTKFIKRVEINTNGSIPSYLTTSRDFYLLYRVYLCMLKYYKIDCGYESTYEVDKFIRNNKTKYISAKYDIPDIYSYKCYDIFPVTFALYDEYSLSTFGSKYNNICGSVPFSPEDQAVFVYKLPALLINLGLLFGKLVGPKYIEYMLVENARERGY